MSSQSRNSRKATQALQLAFAAVLLSGSAAYAADQARSFEITAFSNGTGGAALMSGNYNLAVKEVGTRANTLDEETINTNRCVAYVLTRKLTEAHTACDAAVADAHEQLMNLPVAMMWARSEYRDHLALAYSNRAVLSWLDNDAARAQADLKKAAQVAPKADFVARNLTALESHSTVAQVSLVPKS